MGQPCQPLNRYSHSSYWSDGCRIAPLEAHIERLCKIPLVVAAAPNNTSQLAFNKSESKSSVLLTHIDQQSMRRLMALTAQTVNWNSESATSNEGPPTDSEEYGP